MEKALAPQFFLTGTQRSGTTLLRLLLNNHSVIAIPEEAGFLMPYLNRRKLGRKHYLSPEEKKRFLRFILNDEQFAKWRIPEEKFADFYLANYTYKETVSLLYHMFATIHGKEITGDKSPKFIRKLSFLGKIYPDAKFIHIVRDGRDTFLSLIKRKHHSASSAVLAAFEWRVKERLINRTLSQAPERTIQIRYEDLIRDPERQLRDICMFIGIAFEFQMLEFWKTSEEFIEKQHSNLIFKPIDAANAEKWRTGLSEDQILQYEFIAKELLAYYGYSVHNKRLKFTTKTRYFLLLILGLPRRLLRIIWIDLLLRLASLFGISKPGWVYE